MNDMKIACDSSGVAVDDSTVEIKDSFLSLSPRMFAFFVRHNCRTAFAAMSFVKAFPSEMRKIVGWSEEDFNKFKDNLWSHKLTIDPECHIDRPPMKVAYGAVIPPSLKKD